MTLGQAMLEAQKKLLGEEHPDTLRSASHVAWILWEQGQKDAAMAMWHDLLAVNKRIFGEYHRYTLQTAKDLGNWVRSWEEAKYLEVQLDGPQSKPGLIGILP